MKPRKVGVLTFHRCINYGSYWQACCLVEGLRAQGHEAQLLDYGARSANFAEWKCALQPTLPTPAPRADRQLYRQKMGRFFEAFDQLPLSPRFDLDAPDAPEYDALVVGSDEVWNISHPWYGQKPLFFGHGLRAQKRISYAASFGNWRGEDGLDEYWANFLRGFDALAVRDYNSRAIVERALGFAPPLTLDPCLQWPQFIAPNSQGGEEYLAVYGHNFSPQFVSNARRFAQAHGLKIVGIGYRNDWADEQWLDAGPHDFAQFMARAAGVATNFFHGCVFALLNAKPLAAEVTDYRSVKITELLETVGASAHLTGAATSPGEFEALLSAPISAVIVENIAALRRASAAYLERALGRKSWREIGLGCEL